MNIFNQIKSVLSKKIVIIILIILVAILAFFFFRGEEKTQQITAQIGDVVQEVASTGKIKPNQSVDLGFDKSGRVGAVYYDIGDRVYKGNTIAIIEAGDIVADVSKAESLLQEEIIKLNDIKNTAPISSSDAFKNLEATIKTSFSDADNAVRNQTDQFFKNIPNNPRIEISFTDGNFIHYFDIPSETAIGINASRKNVEQILNDWSRRLTSINNQNISAEADMAIKNLNAINKFLNDVALTINSFTPAEFSYQATVNGYKTTISSARNSVSSAISNLVTAKDKLNSSPSISNGNQFDSVLIQQEKVDQARSYLDSLRANYNKYVITAPFDGIITKQDAKVGGTVSPGEAIVSMISQDELYAEANISEIHIGKIAINNKVRIDLDAFPGETLDGYISKIDPGEIIIDGVVNYKVNVSFVSTTTQNVKSGLTANLKIETGKREGVLSIPLYTVTTEGDEKFVYRLENNKEVKTKVTLGMIGNSGNVEVLDGLKEGDVLIFN